MTATDFIKEFALLADAPNGVQKLREMVLQLAVKGKLVPQDPEDESALVLLEEIATERKRLVTAGQTKQSKPEPLLDNDAVPYAIPPTWQWVRLPHVFYSISPGNRKVKTKNTNPAGAYPVVDQGQSFVAGYVDDPDKLISIPGPVIVFGDHTRAVKFIDFDFVPGADGTKILRPICCYERYFFTVLQSYELENRGYGRHYKILMAQAFPLPPLAEQKRIVAKVDELMRLCDELEARKRKRDESRIALNASCLSALVRSEATPPQDVSAPTTRRTGPPEWAKRFRMIRDNFDILYDTPATVTELRKTILQLAVQGRLVPQDPGDGLVNAIREKVDLQEGADSKVGPASDLPKSEILFRAPLNWRWFTFEDLKLDAHTGIDRRKASQSPECQFAYFKMNNITNDGRCTLEDVTRIDATDEEVHKYALRHGDFLFNTRNSFELVGKTCVFSDNSDDVFLFNNNILRVFFTEGVDPRFVNLWCCSPGGRSLLRERTSSTTNVAAIYQGKLMTMPMPLPPLPEQKRIVVKVDALMRLCDELESTLAQSREDADTLMSAMLHHLVGQKEVAA